MRRLVVFTVLAIGLAIPAAGFAVGDGGQNDGTVSVKNARGRVMLFPFNGAAVGRIGHGRILISDLSLGDGSSFDIWGCDNDSPSKSDTTTICSGDNLRFRAVDGRYKIYVRGSGIFLSAVGRGWLTLDGAGNDTTVDQDGVFSLNDSPYRSLPNSPRDWPLAIPSGG